MLGHKRSLRKYKKVKITPSYLSDQNGSKKLEINSKRKNGKFTNTWKSNIFLNNQWSKEEIKGKLKKKYLETNKNGNNT